MYGICREEWNYLAVGYKINKETRLYEVDPLTAPIVTEAFNAYLDGKTMKQIADDFNATSIPKHEAQSRIRQFKSRWKF